MTKSSAQCYSLVALEGKCFQTKELRTLRSTGKAHQKRGQWFLGPRPGPPHSRGPSRPLRSHLCPLLPLPELPPPGQAPPCPLHLPPQDPDIPSPPPSPPDRSPTLPTDLPAPTPLEALGDTAPPFLWLTDLRGSIIDHSLQASWGITALAAVANFLHDPQHCNMESLLPWVSAYGSPARFHLHHSASAVSYPISEVTSLGILAADYGLKARSASGIRGDDLEDWPNLTDSADRSLVCSHYTRLLTHTSLSHATQEWITAALHPPSDNPVQLTGAMLLDLGDPHLPYSLFEPRASLSGDHAECLPLRFTGDPRLPRTRDHAWTDLLLLGTNPNFAYLDDFGGLTPLTSSLPLRTTERIRWALHSLCQATIEVVAPPPLQLRRPSGGGVRGGPSGRGGGGRVVADGAVDGGAGGVGSGSGWGEQGGGVSGGSAWGKGVESGGLGPRGHKGVPPASPWLARRPAATYGTLTRRASSCRPCGLYYLPHPQPPGRDIEHQWLDAT